MPQTGCKGRGNTYPSSQHGLASSCPSMASSDRSTGPPPTPMLTSTALGVTLQVFPAFSHPTSPLITMARPHNVLPGLSPRVHPPSLLPLSHKHTLLPHPAPGPLHTLCPLLNTLIPFSPPGLTLPFLRSHLLLQKTLPSPLPLRPTSSVDAECTGCIFRTRCAPPTMDLIICNHVLTSLHKLYESRTRSCPDHCRSLPQHIARCVGKTGAREVTGDRAPSSWTGGSFCRAHHCLPPSGWADDRCQMWAC